MSTPTDAPVERQPTAESRRGRWIDAWDPEDEAFWERRGKRIAKKNLAFSIFAEHLGFSIWVLWTIVVINLANAGFVLSLSEQFLLIALPNLIGAGPCGSPTRSPCRGSVAERGPRSAPRCC